MREAPERIWAQDAEPSECNYIGGGWWDEQCGTVQYAHMVEYVRADRIEGLEAKLAKATKALERIVGGEFDGVLLLSLPPQDAAKSYAASTLAELRGDW